MTEEQRASALRLKLHLFGRRHDVGSVAVGADQIYIHVYGDWHGEKPAEWEGSPLVWSTNCGPITALTAS